MDPLRRRIIGRIVLSTFVLALVSYNIYSNREADDFRWTVRVIVSALALSHIARNIAAYRKISGLRKGLARKIIEIQGSVYGDELHQYRPASLDEFPHLDRSFYEANRAWFESNGFSFVGDLENVTLSRAFPKSRSMLRLFIGDRGFVVAAIYQFIHPPRPNEAVRRSVFRIELGSEFSDGTSIDTIKGPATSAARVPGMAVIAAPISTPLAELVRLHQEALATKLCDNPVLTATSFRDMEDIIQAQHRAHTRKSQYKQGVDWGEERRVSVGRELTAREQEIAQEIRRLKRS